METTRQNKISRLLQKELGLILQLENKNSFKGTLITVTKVNVTRDLSIAKVYLSLFATKDKEELLKNIRQKTKKIRYNLGLKLRNQLKAIPSLEFFIDDTLDYIENIEGLLKDK
ncbi:MAG: 30S ribosome-binding factor RbfA [Bacteroidales bacterium]|nr:30S ribosome-binding factor RbfA [Bacteroidales bacterium]